MSHSASPASLTSRQRWLLAVLILSTLVFGGWGNWEYEHLHHHSPNPLSVSYHTLQFLVLHGLHAEEPIPWQLHVGRLAGAAFLFTLGVVTFMRFFHEKVRSWLLHLPWPFSDRRGHVVICGLGNLGLRLAIDAKHEKKVVVAIEKYNAAAIELAREHGIMVIEGDACDRGILKRAALHRCESLFVACAQDATNAAVAAQAGRLIKPGSRTKSPLVCRLLVRDPGMRQLLEKRGVFTWASSAAGKCPDYRVNFHDLDLPDTAARQALRMFPLDFEPIREGDETRVHVVIVGCGPIGQAMAVNAARSGHFANETPTRKTRISIVDSNARPFVDSFKHRFDRWSEFCELNGHDLDVSRAGFAIELEKLLRPGISNELQTIVLCLETDRTANGTTHETAHETPTIENDRKNWHLCLELMDLIKEGKRQLLTCQSTRNGFAALLSTNSTGNSRSLHPFGMIEDLYSWNVLMNESEYRMARAIHEDYARRHDDGPWETLSEAIKESNRHSADHVPIKLRALGYHDAPLQPGTPRIESFSEPQLLLMAKMEHERWCAERWLDGWKLGPAKDREQKISDCLVRWEALTKDQKEKDFEQIETMPKILEGIGRGIYR